MGNLAKFESSKTSETKKAMPTKIGMYAFDINPYLHELFEPILFDSIFLLMRSLHKVDSKGPTLT